MHYVPSVCPTPKHPVLRAFVFSICDLAWPVLHKRIKCQKNLQVNCTSHMTVENAKICAGLCKLRTKNIRNMRNNKNKKNKNKKKEGAENDIHKLWILAFSSDQNVTFVIVKTPHYTTVTFMKQIKTQIGPSMWGTKRYPAKDVRSKVQKLRHPKFPRVCIPAAPARRGFSGLCREHQQYSGIPTAAQRSEV